MTNESKTMEQKRVIKSVDMSQELQDYVFDKIAELSKDGEKPEKEVASLLKKDLDENQGHVWHVIVGTDFGSYITHEAGKFIYFYIGERAYMVFKTG
ncbi:dynein light chain [Saccharomycopsis crataegensis]|uniref:Dynein light chain n=1 Tax=Saccharomycopsis crataegensis TaxID=43959 RepID=A0AAV5QWC3_9ASCO|nr:dynein light chain [Saccharomycopsis crataegensis]